MSNNKKRTIREVYNGNDLSEVVLNLPLTPYSEEFVYYKRKLDKAISDLKVLVNEEVCKETSSSLDLILDKIRKSMLVNKDIRGSTGQIDIEIRNDKYFCVYLEIIGLENGISDIIECFIRWKNDHYYTMWEDLSNPPQELRDLWIKFKDKISSIITSCRKISSQPLPRLLISEKVRPDGNEEGNNKESNDNSEKDGREPGKNTDDFKENENINNVSNDKLISSDNNDSEARNNKEKTKKSRKKGSVGFWGPKTVPKSKTRYISGVSTIRSLRKRTYNSNGRYKNIRDKDISGIIKNIEKGLNSESHENKAEIRNLKRWERIEEKRYELKCKKYLVKPKEGNKCDVNLNDFNNPLTWSNHFSRGLKLNRDECNRDSNNCGGDNIDLFKLLREEIKKIGFRSVYDVDNGMFEYKKLCICVLEKYFGHTEFRKGQFETINSVLLGIEKEKCTGSNNSCGDLRNGSILILPTGYGKSLCYQYLSIITNRWYKKVTLVVTPLISLMQDQLNNLSENIRGAVWNSNVSYVEKKCIIELIVKGDLDILFITPESIFSSYLFKGLVIQNENEEFDLKNNNIGLLCLDEAHCVSEWGHSFRPSYYSSINYLINNFKVKNVLGITATAPKDILSELKSLLKLNNVIHPYENQSIQRNNLTCRVIHLNLLKTGSFSTRVLKDSNGKIILSNKIPKQYNNFTLLWDYVKYSVMNNNTNSKNIEIKGISKRREIWSNCKNILIYVWQRFDVESVTNYLRSKGANALYYHGMMSSTERELVQKSFMENKTNIFVATNSFGMGINKKDIDAVIHWNMPNSLEQYIQETGRCARELDNKGYCLLILSDEDYKLKRQIISSSLPDKTSLRCLIHILLYNYGSPNNSFEFAKDRLTEYDIFSIDLLKMILNTKNTEEIEVILHTLKPYMEYILGKLCGDSKNYNWNYYIKGSPYLKIRCFDENFEFIKEKSEFFDKLFPYCSENSGVITLDLPEASKNMEISIQDLEEKIDSLRNKYKITVETENNKQCVIVGVVSGEKSLGLNEKLFLNSFNETDHINGRYHNIFTDNDTGELLINWKDLLVQKIHEELYTRNISELWKLDVAYISFRKFVTDKESKELIFDYYFSNKRMELYNKLLVDQLDGESLFSLNISENQSFINKINTKPDNFSAETLCEKEMEVEFCTLVEKDMWFNKWNDEFGKTFICKQEIAREFSDNIRRDIMEKTNSCIKAGVSYLIGSLFLDYYTVQWETYRISLEKITQHYCNIKQAKNKKGRKAEFSDKEVTDISHLFKQYSSGLTPDKFEVVFPGDIAKILVGVSSFRFCYRNGVAKFSGFKGREMSTVSKLWGKFSNIPYKTVLRICEEKFKEMATEKLIK
ncbi:RecQ4 SF II RNA helicase [Cryptosporidium ryanae]|uniref:RecQ4 SF II RNA helicase n=1 Tax=Cryptosporidium ryanae TaxID=515981 RepID=UPI00351A687C|nr:RecQ4 SF II RNA helicase [Cryptosporidium ryanae]